MAGSLWLLTVEATVLGPFLLRDVHKTNVAWASFPVVPPTAADGLFAEAVTAPRWVEGDFQPARTLSRVPGFEGLAGLGGYPPGYIKPRPHYRAHLGAAYNYEALATFIPEHAGKKLATVTELVTDRLRFLAVGASEAPLRALAGRLAGRLFRAGKKSVLLFDYFAEPAVDPLEATVSDGALGTIAALPMMEIGAIPKNPACFLPVRSRSVRSSRGGYEVTWELEHCVWQPGLAIRRGTPVWAVPSKRQAVSARLVERVLGRGPGAASQKGG